MSALVQQLVSDGDVSLKEEFDQKMDDASVKVARLFSLVNTGKLDVSILDNLIAFAENPTAPTGTKALGSNDDEKEALNILLNSSKLKDSIKKGLEKLVKGEMQLDNDGNPVTSSAASDPKVQQELTDLRKKAGETNKVLGDIAGHFGIQINTDGSVKDGFPKSVISASDKLVEDAKANPAGTVLVSDMVACGNDLKIQLGTAKTSKVPGSDARVIEKETFDRIQQWADHLASLN